MREREERRKEGKRKEGREGRRGAGDGAVFGECAGLT